MPIAQVENVGVWYRGCTSPKTLGSALYAAIDSVVRAVGRIVVWVDAAADERIARNSSLAPQLPRDDSPMPVSGSSMVSGLVRPMPLSPTPANACAATVTSTYVTSRTTVEVTAARPGVTVALSVSSLTDTVESQPQ